MDGAQPYRNLRAHLVKLENSQAAGLMHVHELDMERETDPSRVRTHKGDSLGSVAVIQVPNDGERIDGGVVLADEGPVRGP